LMSQLALPLPVEMIMRSCYDVLVTTAALNN